MEVARLPKIRRKRRAFCKAPTMASEHKCVLEPDPNLICQICHSVAVNPQQESNCGKLFCTSCIDKLANISGTPNQLNQKKCPNCKKEPKYFPDKRSKREIDNLIVNCKYEKDSCPWIGRLGDAQDHVTKSCDFAEVNCKYEDVGCEEKITRKRLREHEEDDGIHFPLLVDATKKMKKEQNSISGTGKIIIVNNYARVKRLNQIVTSEPFHSNGYKMCLVVTLNGTAEAANHVSVAIKLLEEPLFVFSPFQGTFTVTLLNQEHDKNHYSKTKKMDLTTGIGEKVVVWNKYISHSELRSSYQDVKYLHKDTVYFKVTMESKKRRLWLKDASTLGSTAQGPH